MIEPKQMRFYGVRDLSKVPQFKKIPKETRVKARGNEVKR